MRFSPAQMRSIRRAAGISRSELAHKIDRGFYTVRSYERGEWIPPLEVALEIAAALGVSLEALCEATDQPAAAHG